MLIMLLPVASSGLCLASHNLLQTHARIIEDEETEFQFARLAVGYCSRAVAMLPSFVKAYYTRAGALRLLG